MSCLSPIQEYNEYLASSQGSSQGSSYKSRSQSAHRRNVSAFSTVAELRAEQKYLQSKNKNIRFKVGGDVRSECVMTAIPESHNMQRTNEPTDADMKLLGLTLPEVEDSIAPDMCTYEIRDEIPLNGVSCDQRTGFSAESNDEVCHEDDENSVGLPIAVTSAEHDDVSEMGSQLRGISDRHLSTDENQTSKGKIESTGEKVKKALKKTFNRIANKAFRKIKPFLCNTRAIFEKKEAVDFKRAKGFLT